MAMKSSTYDQQIMLLFTVELSRFNNHLRLCLNAIILHIFFYHVLENRKKIAGKIETE